MACIAQNLSLPPRTEAAVRFIVPPAFRGKLCLMENYAPLKNQFLIVARALIQPHSKYVTGCIVNIGKKTQKLRAFTPVAHISQIDENGPFNKAMMSVDADMNPNSSSTSSNAQIPPHEVRIKALEEIGLKFENQNLTENEFSQLTSLLYEYRDIFCSDHENLPTSNIAEHHIHLTNPTPIRQKQYPLSLQQQNVMEKYVDKLLKANILRPSTSAWNSPAILVKKAHFNVTNRMIQINIAYVLTSAGSTRSLGPNSNH